MNPEKDVSQVNAETTSYSRPRWERWVRVATMTGVSLGALIVGVDLAIVEADRILDGEFGETRRPANFAPNYGYGPDIISSALTVTFVGGSIYAAKLAKDHLKSQK